MEQKRTANSKGILAAAPLGLSVDPAAVYSSPVPAIGGLLSGLFPKEAVFATRNLTGLPPVCAGIVTGNLPLTEGWSGEGAA